MEVSRLQIPFVEEVVVDVLVTLELSLALRGGLPGMLVRTTCGNNTETPIPRSFAPISSAVSNPHSGCAAAL